MSERVSFSEKEITARCRVYMAATYGPVKGIPREERDRWHERLGMLVDFSLDLFKLPIRGTEPQRDDHG